MDKNIIFYDGHCGLCHGWVKFILRFDHSFLFYFSPLQGDMIKGLIKEEIRDNLPDSIVVLTPNNRIYLKSEAVEFILNELGGVFYLVSLLFKTLPLVFKNICYDFIARIRKSIFGEREEVCPIMPNNLRERFLA